MERVAARLGWPATEIMGSGGWVGLICHCPDDMQRYVMAKPAAARDSAGGRSDGSGRWLIETSNDVDRDAADEIAGAALNRSLGDWFAR